MRHVPAKQRCEQTWWGILVAAWLGLGSCCVDEHEGPVGIADGDYELLTAVGIDPATAEMTIAFDYETHENVLRIEYDGANERVVVEYHLESD